MPFRHLLSDSARGKEHEKDTNTAGQAGGLIGEREIEERHSAEPLYRQWEDPSRQPDIYSGNYWLTLKGVCVCVWREGGWRREADV